MKQVLALALVLAMNSAPLRAQTVEHIRFQAGNDNASVESMVRGSAYKDYVLGARGGQRMSVSLSTDGTAYFNILPPGSDAEAIYNSSMTGNDGNVVLPSSGDYRIRVYLMGADKSENRRVGYTLSVGIM